MHLLSLVADRLWLVNKGEVRPYEGDLDSYRTMLLSGTDTDKPAPKPKADKPKRPSRDAVLKLRQDVKKCEQRVEKLTEMEGKVAKKLADPAIYDDVHGVTEWQKKYAEIEDGLALAERLWLEALERLEEAER
jgi:ATP-binding cassette subfamily F protein 3